MDDPSVATRGDGTDGRPVIGFASVTGGCETDGMSDDPNGPIDPFEGLPPELREIFDQMGGSGMLEQLSGLLGQRRSSGPVDWDLARQAALQVAQQGDRGPTAEERSRIEEALQVAEHWLDATTLPAPPDGGRLVVASRRDWVEAALVSLRPMVEPIAAASTRSMGRLATEQLGDLDLDAMGLGPLAGMIGGMDLSEMLSPMGAMLTGMQSGQVLGQLSRQLLGQYELGIATAPRAAAFLIPVNVEEAFAGWDLDPTEVSIALALHEGAHRRLYHAIPWLEAHLHGLIAQFANGMEVDPEQLQRMAEDLMAGVDPDDPESLQEAMARAGQFRLEPTAAQRRVLERLQGVVALVGAWARREMARAASDRLPNLGRIEEVLRRRRATKGDGEELLERLLGLDLQPDDETVGEAFVAAVEEARGPEGLHRALAHPENLPDADELAEPSRWLVRMASGEEIPDDPSELFAGLGDAPHERSAEERRADLDDDTEDGDHGA